ncbi:MAG: 30S ribosomal protein S12 methylthiotransferase RimO [Clostridia bacterium]
MTNQRKEAPDHEKKILIVSGCLSQRYGKELADEMPEVDIFLGVNDYEKLPQLVKEYRKGKHLQAFSCQPDAFYEFSARKIKDNPYSMTLRIAEGCNNCCAYCVIPQIRGAYRSRPMENIIEEAELLASKGCREIIMIAQDVTEYGTDIYGRLMLPELLRKLCRVDGIRWIRLMYCYEDKITDELIEVMASEEKICDYIDIPLQHVSDGVLSAMNRHSTTESIKDTLGRLRTAMPDIHIRTTLITGFPGETEEEFEELLEFVEETRFERLGVFAYSREEGTVAGDMENQIDEDVKTMRADAIMRRQLDISREINESKVGDTMTVMVDGTDEDGAYLGRTVYDAPEIDNTVIFTSDEELVPGDMVQVKITDAFDYDLVGKMEG